MTDIAKFIKEERIKQDIPQKEMAMAARVDPATLCKWENYIHAPKFDGVVKILDFLGYEVVIRKKNNG